MTQLPLRWDKLQALPADVERPNYRPEARRAGIVHLGFGGFHRAHMARYAHDLMQAGEGLDWAIVGAGLLSADRAVAEALAPQEALYTLVERSAEEDHATVIGSVREVLHAEGRADVLLDRMDQARIVSLTVTENGYGLDPATKRLDPHLEPVARDLLDPYEPRTPVGLVVESLRRRRRSGRGGFTALSCDNIQHNGEVLKGAVLAYADRLDTGLAAWIEREARFPSTMVDRITPVATLADKDLVAGAYDVDDRWPIVSEDFRQWVIEDDFAQGRPDWDHVGAQFVVDVAPYERMKLRLLNTSHLAICALGQLMGHTHVHELMGEACVARFMRTLMDAETGPTLRPVPGVDLDAYKARLIRRFANPKVRDTVLRVNTDAPLNYILDPLRERLAAGASIDLLALGLAAWMRRLAGEDDYGRPIEVRHPLSTELYRLSRLGGVDPRPLFTLKGLFGDLGENERLVTTTARWLLELRRLGAGGVLKIATGAP